MEKAEFPYIHDAVCAQCGEVRPCAQGVRVYYGSNSAQVTETIYECAECTARIHAMFD